LIPQLKKELDAAKQEEFVEQLAVELSSTTLDQKYGYNQSLINKPTVTSQIRRVDRFAGT